jgi:hypothetical protein
MQVLWRDEPLRPDRRPARRHFGDSGAINCGPGRHDEQIHGAEVRRVIEVGRYAGDPATLQKIENARVAGGVEFIDENGGGPGVRLRKRQRAKQPK